ncbi:MAG: DNA alkylation repair protein, partial [Myxococcota bacterium]
EPAMTAMYELTQRFSSEFAVRPFIERYPKKTLSRLKKWTRDPNPHVRRWCSEGCRPRLPWGVRLNDLVDDPAPCLEIIERLKDDPELYVRRSVANNLNDIAKDHPEIVVETCRRWWSDGSQERRWIVQHALRSLIKKGHPGALDVLGYGAPKNIAATLKVTPKRVRVGEDVRLNLQLEGAAKQPLMVDYGIHYVLANGKTGRKVFKWKKLDAKSEGVLEKKHSMRETTIRTLRPGRHRVDVQINGHVVAESYFDLRE